MVFKRKSTTPVRKVHSRSLSAELKRVYALVLTDLFATFLKMKSGESLRLGDLGAFEKKEQQVKSGLDNETYVFTKLSFRMFTKLKAGLDEQIRKKYRNK
jgi:hypothetical protein